MVNHERMRQKMVIFCKIYQPVKVLLIFLCNITNIPGDTLLLQIITNL